MTRYAAAASIDSSEKEFFQDNVDAILKKNFGNIVKIPETLDGLDEEIEVLDNDFNTWKKWLPSISGVLFSLLSIITYCIRKTMNAHMLTVNEKIRKLKQRVVMLETIINIETAESSL